MKWSNLAYVMRQSKVVVLLSAMLYVYVLSGCVKFNVERLDEISYQKEDFNNYLAIGYKKLALQELKNQNWEEAEHFASKALMSYAGGEPAPDFPSKWYVDSVYIEELQEARNRMVALTSDVAKELSPRDTAQTYFFYDCWVEETANKLDTHGFGSCRDMFFDSLSKLEKYQDNSQQYSKKDIAKILDRSLSSQDTIPLQMLKTNMVFFDIGSTEIDERTEHVIGNLAKYIADSDLSIVLNGHADGSGSKSFNYDLTKRRNKEVMKLLTKYGVDKSRIEKYHFGEIGSQQTAMRDLNDDKRRVVEILIK